MAENTMPFDELNTLEEYLRLEYGMDTEKIKSQKKQIEDDILDLLILAYEAGVMNVNDMLGADYEPIRDEMNDAIYRKIEDKDFAQRVSEYCDAGDIESVIRVAETEMHYDYNNAAQTTANRYADDNGLAKEQRGDASAEEYQPSTGKTILKVWHTMQDPLVREEHVYLEGQTVGMNDEFYTYDGASALYPGGFGIPELDINCRCWCEYRIGNG